MTHSRFAFALLALLTAACTSDVTEEEPTGDGSLPIVSCQPEDVVGVWELDYDIDSDTICAPGNNDTLELSTDADGNLVIVYRGSESTFDTFDAETCTISASRSASWEEGSEPWWEDHALTLRLSGDAAVGEIGYHQAWNCNGGLTSDKDMVTFDASATRQ